MIVNEDKSQPNEKTVRLEFNDGTVCFVKKGAYIDMLNYADYINGLRRDAYAAEADAAREMEESFLTGEEEWALESMNEGARHGI